MAASSMIGKSCENVCKVFRLQLLPRFTTSGLQPRSRSCSISTCKPCYTIMSRSNSTMATEFKKATSAGSANRRPLFWTSETDPVNHSSRHEGFFYTVSPDHYERLVRPGISASMRDYVKGFQEACLMVRKPALEIINCVKSSDLTMPVIRYVLFGRLGCGKSTSLAQVMHYCGSQDWIVAHVGWAPAYNRYFREVQPSTFKPGRVDQPLDAALWLASFRKMNEPLLNALNLKTKHQYTWSKRETSEIDTPLLEIIEFGLSRTKYASDVMGAILKELRTRATCGDIKVLIAVDGVNSFWGPTQIKQFESRHLKYEAGDLTIVNHWKQMLANDWSGGAVVCTVDGNAAQPADTARYLPVDLLGKHGFEVVDPFIPIRVDNFTDKESYSFIEYLIDRKWIQNPRAQTDEGMKELVALSSGNAPELLSLTIHW